MDLDKAYAAVDATFHAYKRTSWMENCYAAREAMIEVAEGITG
jgi:hypothetical protein